MLRVSNSLRVDGVVPVCRQALVPLVLAALAVPLLQPVFLGFLHHPMDAWSEGFAQVLMRAGIFVIGWVALDLYSAIIRGEERAVLAQWPVDPARVVSFVTLQVAVRSWWLVPATGIVLSPVALSGESTRWGLGVFVLIGAWLMSLSCGAAVLLGAIAAAESEKTAPLLDLLRGNNPRAQAAFLYAPGLVLGLAGAVVVQASFGVDGALRGDLVAAATVVLPLPLALVGWALVPGLARSCWFDGTAVLAEIDARYASLESAEEALRVYLDGLVRFLPSRIGLYALKDLRHGWRSRRTLIVGAWILGMVGLAASWTAAAEGPVRALLVVVTSVLLVASVGAAMESDEPEFLRQVMPRETLTRGLARGVVTLAWVQPCVWPAVAGVGVRRGGTEAAWVLAVGLTATVLGAVLAAGCRSAQRRALAVYAPAATLGGAALAAWISGGLA